MLRWRYSGSLAAFVLLASIACAMPPQPFNPTPPVVAPPPPPIDTAPVDEMKAAKAATDSVNAFTADLYSNLRAGRGNRIVSPYSINTALAMTASGAEGTTRDEMNRVLHLPDADKLGPAFRAMTASVVTPPKDAKKIPELSIANSLWVQKGRVWKKDFLAGTHDDFHAAAYEVDFMKDAEMARGQINGWVEKETQRRITGILPSGALKAETRMVLANAIYFKADWSEAFAKAFTSEQADFTLADGKKVKTPIMYQRSHFVLIEADGFQVLRMPYDGDTISMYAILPEKHDGLPALEKELDSAKLHRWTMGEQNARLEDVKVWFPRFKFTLPTELTNVLQQMGMKAAFDKRNANFKGMSNDPEDLYISRVIHKAFIEVDEQGTEAAAATTVEMAVPTASPFGSPPPPRVKEFHADHPFIFVIKHEKTGVILFIGRVEDPTKTD